MDFLFFFFFFFQAEDGIRDIGVTGVQTCALPISRVEEAQARLTVTPGTRTGSEVRKTTSRPRFGALSAGTTTPKIDMSISMGSMPERAISSAAATLARSVTSMFMKSVPDLMKGVRQPSMMAILPRGPLSSRRAATWTFTGFPLPRVHTVSARSVISSRAEALFGGRRGAGGWSGTVLSVSAMTISSQELLYHLRHSAASPQTHGGTVATITSCPTEEAFQPAGCITKPAGCITKPAGLASQPAGFLSQPVGLVSQPAGFAS